MAGNYMITVTDVNGCSATLDSLIISSPPAMVLTTSTSDANCGNTDGSATVTASNGTPPYNYSWSNGQATQTALGLSAGSYTVTVTDGAGCSESDVISINDMGSPTLSVLTSDLNCNGDTDGAATVTATGGTPPYSYAWSNGHNTENATGLSAGAYVIIVTDAGGCVATEVVDITEPDPILVLDNITPASCNTNDGAIELIVSGGTAPYTYNWSNGETTAIINNLVARCL